MVTFTHPNVSHIPTTAAEALPGWKMSERRLPAAVYHRPLSWPWGTPYSQEPPPVTRLREWAEARDYEVVLARWDHEPIRETLDEFDLLLDAARAGTIGALILESRRGLDKSPAYAENLASKFERAGVFIVEARIEGPLAAPIRIPYLSVFTPAHERQ
jgi:hypothetical protein